MAKRYCEVCVVEGAPEITDCSPCAKIAVDEDTGALYYRNADGDWTAVPGGVGGDNAFSTLIVAGQSNVVAETPADSLTLIAGTNVTITTNAAADSVTINASGGGGNAFGTIAVAGQSNVVADSATDTLTLVAGTNVTLTTSAAGDSVTINAPVSGGGHPIGMMTTLENATTVPITGNTLINTFSSVPTTITEFTTTEPDGHMFVVVATDANTTIANNSSISTLDGANIVMAIGDVAFFIHNGTISRQVAPGGGTGSGLPAGGVQYDLLVKDSGTDGDASWDSSLHHLNIATPGALAVSTPALSVTQQWSAVGTTFEGVKIAITDTASAAGSLPFQVLGGAAGTTNLLSVTKAGQTLFAAGALATPSISFSSDTDSGFYSPLNNRIGVAIQGDTPMLFAADATIMRMAGSWALGWSPGDPNAAGADTILQRQAANHLALRNGTAAQSLSVYNTWTSDAAMERGRIGWAANVLQIGTEHVGASARDMVFITNGVERLRINASGSSMTRTADGTWSGPATDAPLRIESDAAGQGIIFAYNTTEYLTFTAGGIQKAINSAGALPLSISSEASLILTHGGGANVIGFGGLTASEPALKVSGTTLQIRLADNSAFTKIQGQLQTHATAVSEAVTPTHSLVIYDAAGTAYKVAVQAA